MANYTIVSTEPSNEKGFVYVDVLVNSDTEPRRLILPADPALAEGAMATYLAMPENSPDVIEEVVTTTLDTLVDKTIEV